jgi:hypothetical protein
MKSEKIYSCYLPVKSLYYFCILEDNDIVETDCFIKFGDSWATISKDSIWMGKSVKEIRETLEADPRISQSLKHDFTLAKRFDNLF